jgi:trk system potassium uptake protein TrkH
MQFRKSVWSRLSPAQLMALMFVIVILAGAGLLSLPMAMAHHVSFLDNLFTATSATCVTGLLTVNIAESYTTFGQIVILCLIQVGGMGIIFVSSLFIMILGASVSIRETAMVHESFSSTHRIDFKKLIKSIIILLFVFETAGAIAITLSWLEYFPLKEAIYHGIFHSVSAFFNAGISTLPAGLMTLPKSPVQDVIFTILIFAGALGFMTFMEIYEMRKHVGVTRVLWSLQTRIIVKYSFILVGVGAVGFLLFEYNGVLKDDSFIEKVLNSIFHSVSGRTAGFSNVDFFYLNNSTLYLFILLMFIGGAPGSAAGGIKITTFAVLIHLAISRYKGFHSVNIFNRAIPEEIVSRSISIVFISVLVITVLLFVLLITEAEMVDVHTHARATFMEVFFESVSANGTVGLSMGVTPQLSSIGKFIITLMMLAGRLGPLMIAILVGSRGKGGVSYKLSEESVMVG